MTDNLFSQDHTPILAAPLQGYTDPEFRHFHTKVYGGADLWFTPFIRVEKGEARRQDMTRLASSLNANHPLVPQAIFGSLDELKMIVEAINKAGYNRIDLNLGCPFPMQTRRGRGAAMAADIDTMHRVADYIAADTENVYSVKMRLGMESPDEWQNLLPILNEIPLSHITLHPRVATQLYEGELHPEIVDEFIAASRHRVIINGDIGLNTDSPVEDLSQAVERRPGGVMIGRALLARPSIIAEYREGREWGHDERMAKLLRFHSLMFDAYRERLCGDKQILMKLKDFWEYLEPEIGHKAWKAIHKASNLAKYRAAVTDLTAD